MSTQEELFQEKVSLYKELEKYMKEEYDLIESILNSLYFESNTKPLIKTAIEVYRSKVDKRCELAIKIMQNDQKIRESGYHDICIPL